MVENKMIDIEYKQRIVDSGKIRRIQKEYNCSFDLAKTKLNELRRNKQ